MPFAQRELLGKKRLRAPGAVSHENLLTLDVDGDGGGGGGDGAR